VESVTVSSSRIMNSGYSAPTPTTATTPTINAAATVVTAAAGTVKYVWAAGDTATAGYYTGEWEVTYSDGRKLTVPNGKKLSVAVVADLG